MNLAKNQPFAYDTVETFISPKQGEPVKAVIQLSKSEEAKALPIILRHSPGMVLPDRTYVLSEEVLRALKAADIRFTEVSRETDAPTLNGVIAGERI